jgi:hypothetical protein
MKIVLIGEFSGVHAELKRGLASAGHHVTTVSDGDSYKAFAFDRTLRPKKPGRSGLARHLLLDQPRELRELIEGSDVVQFIHPEAVTLPRHGRALYARWLMSSLDDFKGVVSLAVAGCDPYSQPLFAVSRFSPCVGCLRDSGRPVCTYDFDQSSRKQVADALVKRADVIIPFASDEYSRAFAFLGRRNVGPFNFPITLPPSAPANERRGGRLRVLHGITRPGFKGSEVILSALRQLEREAPNRYEVIAPEKLAFEDYLELLKSVNVVVDQLYGAGLGMNALFSMAEGRVVLSSHDANFHAGHVDYRTAPAHDISQGREAIIKTLCTIEGWSDQELAQAGRASSSYVSVRCAPDVVARQISDAWITAMSWPRVR